MPIGTNTYLKCRDLEYKVRKNSIPFCSSNRKNSQLWNPLTLPFFTSPRNTCSKAQEPFVLLDLGYKANHILCKRRLKAMVSSPINHFIAILVVEFQIRGFLPKMSEFKVDLKKVWNGIMPSQQKLGLFLKNKLFL